MQLMSAKVKAAGHNHEDISISLQRNRFQSPGKHIKAEYGTGLKTIHCTN
jgi:hypothetical protein